LTSDKNIIQFKKPVHDPFNIISAPQETYKLLFYKNSVHDPFKNILFIFIQ